MDPTHYDWKSFSITFYYNAHITRVFKTWTEAAGLESFFIERCVYTNPAGNARGEHEPPQLGDHYQWQFRQDFSVSGKVIALETKRLFAFTFGDMRVDVLFRVVEDQTEVQLLQTGIANTPEGRVMGHLNCRTCWVFFMTNLASILATGTDLRDEDPERVSSMEVGFLPLSQR